MPPLEIIALNGLFIKALTIIFTIIPMDDKLKQKLPNSKTILILAIFSIVFLCFPLWGFILGIFAYSLAIKSTNLYKENPEKYYIDNQIKTGKIIAIIGIILNILALLLIIYLIIVSVGDFLSVEYDYFRSTFKGINGNDMFLSYKTNLNRYTSLVSLGVWGFFKHYTLSN